jgi:hypothetical protein
MILTPFHCGEILQAILLRGRVGTYVRSTGTVIVAERVFEFLALVFIAAVLRSGGWMLVLPPEDKRGNHWLEISKYKSFQRVIVYCSVTAGIPTVAA